MLGLLIVSAGLAAPAAADHEYHQSPSITWETTELDVQLVGVEDPLFGNAIHNAIDAWRTGIENASTSGPLDDLVIRDYVPGADEEPPEGFEPEDVEIVIVPQGTFAVYRDASPVFSEDGIPTRLDDSGDPLPVGSSCVALAPRASDVGELNKSYRVAAHEFGHCLGLGHSFNHDDPYKPDRDLMASGAENRSCPSNLNIRVLEHAYRGDDVTVYVDASNYEQVDCDTGTPSRPTTVIADLVPAQTPLADPAIP